MEMEGTKPHVALLASPGMGHFIPMLELAKRFVSYHGFKVTVFVVPTAARDSLPESQLLQSPFPHPLDIVLLPFIDPSNLVGADASVSTKIMIKMHESLPFLRSHISEMEPRPTALIVDLFGDEAIGIADEFNMSKFVLITSNAWFFALLLFMPEIDRKEVEEHMKKQKPLNVPGCKPVKWEDTLEVFLMDYDDPEFQRFLDVRPKMASSDGILVNTWEEIEPSTLKALREANKLPVYPIGPVVRPIEKPKPPPVLGTSQVLAWLHQQPNESVIYVSFGSGGTLSGQQLRELAWGLELSQQRFVWVVRPPIDDDSSGSFFEVGNGSDGTPDYLPDGFLTRTHNRGFLVPSWAPQVEVLSHPSIGAFLTHCGWNSTMESLVNGVPMIAWPLYAEQKMNAALLTEDIGASIRAKADGLVGREEIKSMVRRILVDDQGRKIRARLKELKISAAKALSDGGSSRTSLSQVADEICIHNLKMKA